MELIEIEIPALKANSLLRLKLHEATEDGIGAVFVKCDFESRLKRLPPFRYQLYSFGNDSLVSLPFQEILDKLASNTTFPNILRLISCPLAWNLYFPQHKKKLNLKIERSNDAVQIHSYEKPYHTQGPIPNLLLGSQYIAAINGVLAHDLNNQKILAMLKDPTSYPLTLRIDIKQDESSKELQRSQLLHRYTEKSVILSRRRTSSQVSLPQSNALKKHKKAALEVPATPPTSIENPIEILDSSDDDVEMVELSRNTPSKVEHFTRNKAIATPLGIGTILGTKSTAVGKIVKVQLPFGKGYFHQSSVKGIDDIPFAIYKRQQAKGQIVLTYGDIVRLEETQLFNDTILDFYLSYLMDTIAPNGVYVCSTFLYGHYQSTRPQGADKAYAAVKNWTKGIDLFDTKFLVVPVNEKGHWSVAIVCNLYQLTQKEYCRCAFFQDLKQHQLPNTNCTTCQRPRDLSREAANRVCIIMLDSLKCHKTSRITKFLREYLQMDWDIKHKAAIAPLDINNKTMPVIVPSKIPRQENNVDCGVFLLHYVELFLQKPPQLNMDVIVARKTTNPTEGVQLDETWFAVDAIPAKRKELQRLVRDPSIVTILDAPEKPKFSNNPMEHVSLQDITYTPKKSVNTREKATKPPEKSIKTPEKTTRATGKTTKPSEKSTKIPEKVTRRTENTSKPLETATKATMKATRATEMTTKATQRRTKAAGMTTKATGMTTKTPDMIKVPEKGAKSKARKSPKASVKSPRLTKPRTMSITNDEIDLDKLSMPQNIPTKMPVVAAKSSVELENILAINGPVSVENGSIWIL